MIDSWRGTWCCPPRCRKWKVPDARMTRVADKLLLLTNGAISTVFKVTLFYIVQVTN